MWTFSWYLFKFILTLRRVLVALLLYFRFNITEIWELGSFSMSLLSKLFFDFDMVMIFQIANGTSICISD